MIRFAYSSGDWMLYHNSDVVSVTSSIHHIQHTIYITNCYVWQNTLTVVRRAVFVVILNWHCSAVIPWHLVDQTRSGSHTDNYVCHRLTHVRGEGRGINVTLNTT